jgi:hypothetical protein
MLHLCAKPWLVSLLIAGCLGGIRPEGSPPRRRQTLALVFKFPLFFGLSELLMVVFQSPTQDALVEHEQKGLRLLLANPSRVVVHQIERAGLDLLIGREFIHVRMHEAVTYCKVGCYASCFAGVCFTPHLETVAFLCGTAGL